MDQQSVWIGLDLGEKRSSVCIMDGSGEVLHEQECNSDVHEIELSFLKVSRVIALIAVEAGTGTSIVRMLRSRGYPLQIFEARKSRRFLDIRRSKTDRSDARGLAEIARLGCFTVSQVHLKSLTFQQLRSELLLREKLVRVRVAVEASLRSRLVLYGGRLKIVSSRGGIRRQVDTEAARIRRDDGIDLLDQLQPLVRLSEDLRLYLSSLDRSLSRRAREDPICRRFMEVPGIGPICALSFYSAVEDPTRFARTTDVGAYLGLIPRRYQSGNSSRSLGITKTGNALTRRHLVTAAIMRASDKHQTALRDWHQALRQRIGSQKARIAVARKLSVLLLTLWKNGTHYEPYPPNRLSPPRSPSGGGGLDPVRAKRSLKP